MAGGPCWQAKGPDITLGGNAKFETNNPGHTASNFVDIVQSSDDYVEWTVFASFATSAEVSFKYTWARTLARIIATFA